MAGILASLAPIAIDVAKTLIPKVGEVLSGSGGKKEDYATKQELENAVERLERSIESIRTVNGYKEIESLPESIVENRAFEKSRLGINDRTFAKNRTVRGYAPRYRY